MSVGFAVEKFPRPEQREILWRMQGSERVVTAALHTHPAGTELRVYFELESADDPLHSQVERSNVTVLEDRAEALRAILLEKGWARTPASTDVLLTLLEHRSV